MVVRGAVVQVFLDHFQAVSLEEALGRAFGVMAKTVGGAFSVTIITVYEPEIETYVFEI